MAKKTFSKEFIDFILHGDIKEAIIGFTVGIAFKDVITAFVDNVITPPIGLLIGNVHFNQLFIDLSGTGYQTLTEAEAAGAPIIKYGVFLNELIDLFIIGFVIFIVIRYILKRDKSSSKEKKK